MSMLLHNSSLIIETEQHSGKIRAEKYSCPCEECKGKYWDHAYSNLHVKRLGWKFYLANGLTVAVCPTCMNTDSSKNYFKEYHWRRKMEMEVDTQGRQTNED